ncbi:MULTISPECIES: RdgB/HAM1 family non-canonical purine NTP pyrophosphatase [unclassified Haematospirillum]|uniref:RdgB/HAM1 family non-canonical purine NTP pyrophosphatase n=1 Tax=unclassified Haematospirillum TaxID=2622088 RepID=UPI00143A5D0E|nr:MULTISPECIES: RdgB/HAM1 family non-canonical purine NTP pyrophosphatase [unclassified Haematospirillum]NKD55576.1 RdgB/HAM1 family non-canonical purine NTP pyrophosphatase [Haematospirillum sp. H4890]NKD75715.1 RdgB/HAM1 family non-canonical purine NTP pyrophosphatase [Haematospirillum sp. H4485]
MARRFDGSRLVVASHNAGKVREIRDLFRAFQVDVVSSADLDLPEPEETAATFSGNAAIKALAAAKASGLPALSDDSGLSVSALGGEPGIYSARWAGPEKDFAGAMRTVHDRLSDHPDRSACFVCALCLAWPDGHTETFVGQVDGSICWPPRGDRGFGYDPFFVPDGYSRTFAEFVPEEKHAISHRARAFQQLVKACFD